MRLAPPLLAVTVLVALVPSHVEAGPIIFTDRALFEAITGPHDIERFDRKPVYEADYIFDSCAFHLTHFSIGGDCHAAMGVHDGVATLGTDKYPIVAFNQPRSAVGFDYHVNERGDGIPAVMPFAIGSVGFFLTGSGSVGVLDTTAPISFMGPAYYVDPETPPWCCSVSIDNVLMTRVPEPSAVVLFGGAFALLQTVRRRRPTVSNRKSGSAPTSMTGV